MGGLFVALEKSGEALGGEPALESIAEIVRAAKVAKPNAAAGGELAEEGATVGGEDEGEAELALCAPIFRMHESFLRWLEAPAVSLGLLESGGNVEVFAFCFNGCHWGESDEENVVGGP